MPFFKKKAPEPAPPPRRVRERDGLELLFEELTGLHNNILQDIFEQRSAKSLTEGIAPVSSPVGDTLPPSSSSDRLIEIRIKEWMHRVMLKK